MEKSQQTTQKYNKSEETILSSYMPIKWATYQKWTNPQKSRIFQN